MCGICGIVHIDGQQPVSEDRLLRMRQALIHRGPDDAGVTIEGSVGLAHRRLSILDLSARGRQPMASASKRFWITYNGEIYNYKTLRDELSTLGHKFRSDTDTEVLVEGLESWGLPKLLSRLDGIFAFAAWDRQERKLFLVRDQLGVKPLYYSSNRDELVFASEVQALWAGGLSRAIDPNSLEELLIFRFVAGECTPFSRVKRLQPGHYLEFSGGHVSVHPYWRPIDHVGDDPAYVSIWHRRFTQAVSDQLISDVPLGTMLSGGIDSSTVTAEVARIETHSVQTFTVSVPPEEGLDEWPFAETVANLWNCRSHQVRVPAGDILDRLRAAQSYHDEPFVLGNDLYIFELSRLAKQHVTVLLSGEEADETLGGYTRYEPIRYPKCLELATTAIGAPVRKLLALTGNRSVWRLSRLLSLGSLEDALLYNSAHLYPCDLESVGFNAEGRFEVRRAMVEEAASKTHEPVKQLMLYDIQTFLPAILNRNDRMTMAASIECRVPFLAIGVVEAALKLPVSALFSGRYGKKILRDHAANLLPDTVLRRRKWGLGIPWERYFRHAPHCRDFVENLATTELARAMDARGLTAAIGDFLSGDNRQFPIVYEVFSLAVWWEQVLKAETKVHLN